MKKIKRIMFSALALSLLCISSSYAEDVAVSNAATAAVSNLPAAQTSSEVVEVSNKTAPKLVAPVVEDSKSANQSAAKKAVGSKKLDLRAVIFDPSADFKAQAEAEGREMTRLEDAEYDLHEALHGEIVETSKLSRNGVLNKYLTAYPKKGPLKSVTITNAYRGDLQNIWLGENYQNTQYATDSAFTMIEGKSRNGKVGFRSMWCYNPGKDGHDFFNDVWGDQYITYNFNPRDQFLAGYARNAGGLEGWMSPLSLPFFGRSQIAKTYNNVRSLTAKVQGNHKYYEYSAGIGSAGRYFMDWVPGGEFIGSFGIKPLAKANGKYGNLAMGGGITAGNAEARYEVGNAYIDYEYKRINATLEYGSARGSNGSTGFTTNLSEGYAGTIAYRLTPKIQILGRYDQFDPNKDKKNDIRREYTVGLNYFLKEQSVKLMVNYTVYSIETGIFGSQIIIGTQFII